MSSPDDRKPERALRVNLNELSTSAYLRLIGMRNQETTAANVMTGGDCYPDFFLETPTQKFWEHIGPPDAHVTNVPAERMAMIDRLGLGADGYGDFFVDKPDGGGFHEKFLDSGPSLDTLINEVSARVNALGSLGVMQAYLQMQGR